MLTTVTVDIGTTSVKLCLFGEQGDLLESGRRTTPTRTDVWGEIYDVESLLDLVARFIEALEPRHRAQVGRVAITGVGESGGLVRPDGSLASPMILWHDQRGAPLLARLSPSDRNRIYRITGLPVNANYGLSKAAWAVRQADDPTGEARWLNIAEYLAATMTGQRWSEYSLASRTMALDLTTGGWSAEVCDLLDLDPRTFPELRAAGDGIAMRPDYAQQVGLPHGVQVHVAGHDHMVGGVGAGLGRDELLNSTGTTEGLLFYRSTPLLNDQAEQDMLANGFACTGADYTLFASIPTGGSAFATLQGMLGIGPQLLTSVLQSLHQQYVAGQIDLARIPLVLPQFRGSPPPTKRASARAAIAGLATDTTTEDLVFGCFLGMALQFDDVLALFQATPSRVKVIGPASRNPLWLQLKADLLNLPLSVSGFPEVVSLGAQAISEGRAGDWTSLEPTELDSSSERHEQLTSWVHRMRPRWEYLKGVPE